MTSDARTGAAELLARHQEQFGHRFEALVVEHLPRLASVGASRRVQLASALAVALEHVLRGAPPTLIHKPLGDVRQLMQAHEATPGEALLLTHCFVVALRRTVSAVTTDADAAVLEVMEDALLGQMVGMGTMLLGGPPVGPKT